MREKVNRLKNRHSERRTTQIIANIIISRWRREEIKSRKLTPMMSRLALIVVIQLKSHYQRVEHSESPNEMIIQIHYSSYKSSFHSCISFYIKKVIFYQPIAQKQSRKHTSTTNDMVW